MSAITPGTSVPKILIVGGGYAGFYTAFKLEKHLKPGEAEVTLVDPLPYLTYQPFLPEVVAGSIEARHAVTSHRRHLKTTKLVSGKVLNVDHASKTATIEVPGLEPYKMKSDKTHQRFRCFSHDACILRYSGLQKCTFICRNNKCRCCSC